jgi:lipoyl(octanoyl) transferase
MLLMTPGLTDYRVAVRFQQDLARRKREFGLPDTLILLTHPLTITIGVRGSLEDLRVSRAELESRGIEVVLTDRGGQTTLHYPEQLVCYPVIDLRRRRLSVSEYMRRLEETVLLVLRRVGVNGMRLEGRPGVWTEAGKKIASVGVRITGRIAYHGFSLNVGPPPDLSAAVILCGEPAVEMTCMSSFTEVRMDRVMRLTAESFAEVFDVETAPASNAPLSPGAD